MMGASPPDASEIVMLTEEGIRISLGPRNMQGIIEELGPEEAKLAHIPMIVSQSGKMDGDCRALSLLGAALCWRLVAKLDYLAVDRPDIGYAASIMGSHASSPKDADMVILKRVWAISDWSPKHLDALQMVSAIRPHHGIH